MKKLIPCDIARDLQEYLYDDELTLEFHKFFILNPKQETKL